MRLVRNTGAPGNVYPRGCGICASLSHHRTVRVRPRADRTHKRSARHVGTEDRGTAVCPCNPDRQSRHRERSGNVSSREPVRHKVLGSFLKMFPFRDTSRTPSSSEQSSARKPSHLISKSQSGCVNGLGERVSGMGWNCISGTDDKPLAERSIRSRGQDSLMGCVIEWILELMPQSCDALESPFSSVWPSGGKPPKQNPN